MIISKKQKLHNDLIDTLNSMRSCLPTERGSSEARKEKIMLREKSFGTGICPYCEQQIVDRSPRHVEACVDCAGKIDRLLMMKSKLFRSSSSVYKSETIQRFVTDYSSLAYVPASLRCTDTEAFISRCYAYIGVLSKLDEYEEMQRRKQIAENFKKKRLDALRKEYLRYKDKMSEEDFEDLIQSQYVQRFSNEIM